ncbi:MAG: insulinase family protein [Chitinispirillaceae bacterium]|nr:insulinase family protein [Chitinispirillaceae bacterium]
MTARLPSQQLTENTVLHGFVLEHIHPIEELQTTGYLFRHRKSGARCLHLFNDDPDNLFSIAFRTPVSDSTGVPHILEHSVLCGSKRYPVKDPFQEMLKGSMQTFLNALTYPDKTVYPVASQVEKDYFNLAAIYADAVFAPQLSENTFYQEGWHFDVEDPALPVGIKGIVYNEMKGVFSNFSSHVERKTLSELFPDTTYHFESGGDPEHITDLTYEQFIEFHRRYYHPSNAFIILYGNIPSEKTLRFLDESYFHDRDMLSIDASVAPQPLWNSPRAHSFEAPAPREDEGTATIAVSWIFGDSTDPVMALAGRIISYYLLDTESSPLKRALIDSGLGEDLADLSGFDTELRQTVFAAGLRKAKPQSASAIETCILSTLEKVVTEGFDHDLLEGALRQVEFGLREVTGGHFPYHLRLAERCYRSWIYGGDPFAHLAFEHPLSVIKEHMKNGATFFSDCIREHLLENPHRLLVSIIASPEMGTRLEEQTVRQAEQLSASFTPEEKERLSKLTATLLEQQKAPSPPEALAKLPRLDIADLPRNGRNVHTFIDPSGGTPFHCHEIFTSGITYLDLGFDLNAIPDELLPYIPLYSEYLTRCGAAGYSYEQMATRIALSTGGLDTSVTGRTKVGTLDDHSFTLFFHAKSLYPRFEETVAILHDLLHQPDLSHEKLLRDIILEERNSLHNAIIGSGHQFAMTHAAASLLRTRAIDEQLRGITQLRFLESLVRTGDSGAILHRLQKVHTALINRAATFVIITSDTPDLAVAPAKRLIATLPPGSPSVPPEQKQPSLRPRTATGIEISSAVNFVGKVWKTEPVNPTDTGRLLLMGKTLSAGYLWDKVRVEGGAYGGMASASIAYPLFSCASYRDPNLSGTINHFQHALAVVAAGLPQSSINQNIIGTIGQIDSPHPPHSRGFNESIGIATGNNAEFRQQMRDAIFSTTAQDMAMLAKKLLESQDYAISVLGSAAAFDRASKDGFNCKREPLLPSATGKNASDDD